MAVLRHLNRENLPTSKNTEWNMPDLVHQAETLIAKAHEKQIRKYTGEPYVNHCHEVYDLLKQHGGGYATDTEVLAAALLHDVIEDTSITVEEITDTFGHRVASIVEELTNKYPRSTGLDRRERKAKEAERLTRVSQEAMAIKLADIAANVRGIVKLDPEFAKTYLSEKLSLLPKLKGPPALWHLAFERVRTEMRELVN
jgi:(p)ppGpp synthase/HD superfamily hydrolase